MNKNKLFEEIMRIGGNITTASIIAAVIQPFNYWFMVGACMGLFIVTLTSFKIRS